MFQAKESRETWGCFRPRAWAQPPENTMWFVWTLPASLPDAVGKKNLGSKCHSPAPCAARKHRNAALAELSRCWALDMGFCSLPHPLSFEPLSNFTQQGTEDTYRSATVRCVGRKPRNDWWWLGLLQQQAFIPGKNHPICPEALLRNKTIYGSFCALGHLW